MQLDWRLSPLRKINTKRCRQNPVFTDLKSQLGDVLTDTKTLVGNKVGGAASYVGDTWETNPGAVAGGAVVGVGAIGTPEVVRTLQPIVYRGSVEL